MKIYVRVRAFASVAVKHLFLIDTVKTKSPKK